MIRVYKIVPAVFLLLVISSCKKEQAPAPAPEPAPAPVQVYDYRDSVLGTYHGSMHYVAYSSLNLVVDTIFTDSMIVDIPSNMDSTHIRFTDSSLHRLPAKLYSGNNFDDDHYCYPHSAWYGQFYVSNDSLVFHYWYHYMFMQTSYDFVGIK